MRLVPRGGERAHQTCGRCEFNSGRTTKARGGKVDPRARERNTTRQWCARATRAPIRVGSPSSTCTMVPSWRLVRSPTTIAAMSPRSTAPYHTLACAPSVTSPNTTAPGAINAVGWMLMLLPHRLEYPLDPRVYGLAVPLSGVPAQGLRHVQRLVVERVEVGGSEHARLQRRALLGDMDQQNGLAREYGGVRGHGNARQRQRQRTSVETEMVLIVGGPILVARSGVRPSFPRPRLQLDPHRGRRTRRDDHLTIVRLEP